MEIPVEITEQQHWIIADLKDTAESCEFRGKNQTTESLNDLKKQCVRFLEIPIIRALTGE